MGLNRKNKLPFGLNAALLETQFIAATTRRTKPITTMARVALQFRTTLERRTAGNY